MTIIHTSPEGVVTVDGAALTPQEASMLLAAEAMKEAVLQQKRFVMPVRGDGADVIPAELVMAIDSLQLVRSLKP